MIDIKKIYPSEPELSLNYFNGLIRSIFMKSCFNINVKRTLGFVGFYSNYTQPEGWTVKTLYNKGVYGVVVKSFLEESGAYMCTLKLKYFPDADEKLLDSFSIAEILITDRGDYSDMVRDFASIPTLDELFDIGELILTIDKDALNLSLKAETCSKTIIKEGLYIKNEDGLKELVSPMGTDRNLNTFEVAKPFFRSFAGALNYSLEMPAIMFSEMESESSALLISGKDDDKQINDSECRKRELSFTYGRGEPLNLSEYEVVVRSGWWDEKSADENKIMDNRPRMLIISGFLGSGKTTFIKKLIEHETDKNRFVGIIQNEAGETGLDGYLVDYDYSMVQIDDGCVCCSLSGQLKAAVGELSKERVPDTIILETSGIANPMNLIDDVKDLKEVVRFDSVTTIVDASNAGGLLAGSDLMQDQVRAADILVLNKVDLATEDNISSLVETLHGINRDALLIKAVNGDTNFSVLYGNERGDDFTAKIEDCNGSTHTHEHISARKIELPHTLTEEELKEIIEKEAKGAFRVKGIIDIAGADEPVVVQGVQGRVELIKTDRTPPPERFIVVIGRGV